MFSSHPCSRSPRSLLQLWCRTLCNVCSHKPFFKHTSSSEIIFPTSELKQPLDTDRVPAHFSRWQQADCAVSTTEFVCVCAHRVPRCVKVPAGPGRPSGLRITLARCRRGGGLGWGGVWVELQAQGDPPWMDPAVDEGDGEDHGRSGVGMGSAAGHGCWLHGHPRVQGVTAGTVSRCRREKRQ